MVKEGIDLWYNNNDYLSQSLKDTFKGVLNHDGRISIDQLPHAQDWNVASNNFLQDEIKNRHDAQAELEKERDNLATENQKLVRKSKRYKNKLSKARSRIDSQLKRPLQANDFKYPYSVDATDQTLLAIRKLL